ncbi:MAG: hypothetical protein WC514_01590 [Candidatus Paceibacterota bacterium]
MKVHILHDPGSVLIPEDGLVFKPPYFYGVTDGISGVYLPQEGPKLFNGMTGGQFASYAISRAFASAPEEKLPRNILREANLTIRETSERNGLSLQESDLLPSAAFIVAGIEREFINIIQGGDSLAVWLNRDGTVGGTPNRVFFYEEELIYTISSLMKKHGKDRQEMWKEYRPILSAKRRANVNTEMGGFSLLNGQPESEKFWQEFILVREEVSLLILFSDGFVPFEWTENERSLAEKVIGFYLTGGLHKVVGATRFIAEGKKASSHEDYEEATAVSIKF